MEITLAGSIKIVNMPFSLKAPFCKLFSIPNPAYIKAKERKKPTWGMDKVISLYATDGISYYLGRGLLNKLSDFLDKYNYKLGSNYTFVDNRMDKYSFDYGELQGTLRPYQKEAVEALCSVTEGIFEAPPGAGKTFTGIGLIQKMCKPAIWITHTEELMLQAAATAQKLTNIGKVGLIYSKQKTLGDKLTVISVKTLFNNPELIDMLNRFIGVVIVDEAHHTPANTFLEVIFKLNAKYIYGLTATPYRPDGLTELMHAAVGQVELKVTREQLYTEGYLIKPTIVPIYTKHSYTQASDVENNSVDAGGEDFNYHAILENLYNDEDRIKLVVMNILENVAENNYQLVLINNKEYIYKIYNCLMHFKDPFLKDKNIKANPIIFTADLSSVERPKVLKEILNKEYNIIFATQLAKEGLDVPHLNILHLVTPRKGDVWNKAGDLTGLGLEQEVGRVQRPAMNKSAATTKVFDYVDHLVGVFNTQFATRRAVYKRLGLVVPRKPSGIESSVIADFIRNMEYK